MTNPIYTDGTFYYQVDPLSNMKADRRDPNGDGYDTLTVGGPFPLASWTVTPLVGDIGALVDNGSGGLMQPIEGP